jgi:uncharacterized protein (DUF58 family)
MAELEGFVEDLATLDSRQFAIAIRKLADSLSYGIDKSPFVGGGIEYVQSRPYQAGDSIRSIDWRVTARTRKPFVKEYEAPKSVPCLFFVDTSASMTIASSKSSKYELALYVAGGLALACLDRVSPVGVIGAGERTLRVQPSLSRARVLQWLLQLRRYRLDERTNLGARINEVSPSLAQRSLIVVLSDLHDVHALMAIKHVAQVHDCVVLQLVDPSETGLRGSGFFRAREAETGREFVTHGRARWIDPTAPVDDLRRAGVDHLELGTDQPCASKLRLMFRNRGAAARGAR